MTRVLAHAHSTWSHDGHIALSSYAEVARSLGCSAVLLTEHEESGWDDARYEAYVAACHAVSMESEQSPLTAALSPQAGRGGRVRIIPGIEFNQDGYHVLCYGLRHLPRRPSPLAELAADVHRQGCVLALAHPGKYHWRVPDALIAGVDAIEIWNSKWIYDGAAGPHPRSHQLAANKQLIAGQDVHKPKHLSPLILMTRGDDVLADIASGSYECAWGTRVWSLEALREMNADTPGTTAWRVPRARGIRARAHRVWMDVALAGYRAVGRALREGSADAPVRRIRQPLASTPRPSTRPHPAPAPSMAFQSSMPLPSVSVVLPIRNEAAFIGRALASVLAQDYPVDRLEVLVADGRSTDATRDIVGFFESRSSGRVRLIDNPGRIVPTGLNAAIAAANGSVIVRVDGHCEVPPDFVRRAVTHLSRDAVDCVGGILDTIGQTRIARVIAAAMSARFGVGGSAFRSTSATSTSASSLRAACSMLTDTVAFPAFTREAIARTGWFDEELVRNQDDEYSYRLRRLGGRILLATDMRARYYSRGTLRGLWRQCFEYGYWKVRVLQKHPRQMRARQFAPAMFVAGLASSAIATAFAPWLWAMPALIFSAYIAAASVAALAAARRHGWWRHPADWMLVPILAASFATMHVAYGAGSLTGAVGFWRRWGSLGHEPAPRRGVA
jgi:glycosyltransferase involved in cell wall biosynthesis